MQIFRPLLPTLQLQAYNGMIHLLSQLFHGVLGQISTFVIILFFLTALVYYGLVLLTTSLVVEETNTVMSTLLSFFTPSTTTPILDDYTHTFSNSVAAPVDDEPCDPDKLQFTSDNFKDIFIVSCSELPMLAIGALLVDVIGRKKTMAIFAAITTIALIPLALGTPLCDHVFAMFDAECPPRSAQHTTIFIFFARGCAMTVFQVVYVYAPEALPTSVRAFGMGIGNAAARVGGMICPFFAVSMVKSGLPGVAVLLFAVCSLIILVLAAALPYETKGSDLCDTPEELAEDIMR